MPFHLLSGFKLPQACRLWQPKDEWNPGEICSACNGVIYKDKTNIHLIHPVVCVSTKLKALTMIENYRQGY